MSQRLLSFWVVFSEKITDRRENFLGSVGRRNIPKQDRIPDVVISIKDESMIWSVFRVESHSQEHLTDIRRDRVLISTESQEHSEQILEPVRRVLDL